MKSNIYIIIFSVFITGCYNLNRQIVDKNCKTTIYGYLHSDYDILISIYPAAGFKESKYYLNLKRDSLFSACLLPNTYKIADIIFNINGFQDVTFPIPDLRFSVQPNSNNYIGDIYIDSQPFKNNIKLKGIRRGENNGDDNVDYDYSSTESFTAGLILDIFVDEIKNTKKVKHYIRIIDSVPDSQNVVKNLIILNK